MRRLNAGDLIRAGKMFSKVLPELSEIDYSDHENESQNDKAIRLGKNILPIMLLHCYDDFIKWLADIAELDIPAFEKMPLDYPLEVITELAKSEDLESFFEKLLRLLGTAKK